MSEKKKMEDATKKVKITKGSIAAVDGGAGTKATEEDIFQYAVYCHACWNFGVPPVSYMSWIELGRPSTASS